MGLEFVARPPWFKSVGTWELGHVVSTHHASGASSVKWAQR